MKKLLLFLILSLPAFAQNSRYDSVALGPRGPIPNASIAICTQPANTTTTPCSPLANLCSSLTDATCTSPNPVTADSLGNYHFYGKPTQGPFTIQLYGPQVASPVSIPDQTLGGSGSSIAVKSLNNIQLANPTASDPCAEINADIAALAGVAGVVDARGFQGAKTCATSLLAGLSPSPITLLLPRGTWTFTTVPIQGSLCGGTADGWNDLQIIGQGLQTEWTTSTARTLICMKGAGASTLNRVRISGLYLKGTAASSADTGFGINLEDCVQCEIDHVWIDTFGAGGIFLQSTSGSQFSTKSHIHHNWVTNTFGSNLLIGANTSETEVDHNIIYATHRNCIDTNGPVTKIHDNICDGVTGSDSADMNGILAFQATGAALMPDIEISNNYVNNVKLAGIRVDCADVDGCNRAKVKGNSVSNNNSAHTVGSGGIVATANTAGNSKDISVVDNSVFTSGDVGIEVDAFNGAGVENNTVIASWTNGYQFNASNNYRVVSNYDRDSRTSGAGTAGGFLFFASAGNLLFSDNQQISPNTSPSFGLSFAQTSGNMFDLQITATNKLSGIITTSGTVSVNDSSSQPNASTAGCTTAASAGAACTTVVTWSIPYADTGYTNFVCRGVGVTSGVPLDGGVTAVATGTVTFQTVAATASAAKFTNILCFAR